MESQLGLIEQSFSLRYSSWVCEVLNELPDSFTITDPSICGHPIVFASGGFLKVFGYSKHEVVGRNGRMFQGAETDRRTVMEIREAIREERGVQVSLLNYRKDGTPFWMLFHMCPVFSKEDGRVINFVGVQVPIVRRQREMEVNVCEDGGGIREIALRCCRRESCLDTVLQRARISAQLAVSTDENTENAEIEIHKPCEASEVEKTKAAAATRNIISALTHYSEQTGKLVCIERCCFTGNRQLAASLNISLGRIKQSFVLTDVQLPDMPIVYVSDAFLKLTGYDRHEVLGKNCRFLSGRHTDPIMQFKIKECIQTEQACTVRILNYRKDRSSFWNLLHISPVRKASGKVAYFVGVQIDDGCKNENAQASSPEIRQLSVVGAVKVALRGLSMATSSSQHQHSRQS